MASVIEIPPGLQSRMLGKYPVSAGTSLALEGIFGIHDQIQYPREDRYPYKNFDVLLINLRTLLRNVISSVTAAQAEQFTPEVLAILIAEETSVIAEVVKSVTRDKLEVIYYTAMYDNLQKSYPHARVKKPKTGRQQEILQLETETMTALETILEKDNFNVYPSDILPNMAKSHPRFSKQLKGARVLYVTHLPLDLIHKPSPRASLLESYTGKVKGVMEFTSKLKGKPTNVPFDLMSIQMFGDSGDMFEPLDKQLRKDIIELGKLRGWNATTTPAKIIENCKMNNNSKITGVVRNLYKPVVKK